jgi:hypothetical protein
MTRHLFLAGNTLLLAFVLPCFARSEQSSRNRRQLAFQEVVPFSAAQDSSPAPAGMWMSPSEIATLPLSGPSYVSLKQAADQTCRTPDLTNQNESANSCILAKAFLYARTGQNSYFNDVAGALRAVVSTHRYQGRALSLARKLPTYVIAADLVDLKTRDPELDASFRSTMTYLLTADTVEGPRNLIECHERRPNNWGTHCGAARAAVAAYLGNKKEIARVAQVFKGWLGDRSSYAAFQYGADLSWQCNPAIPVGINPKGCVREGHSLDGVLPDDQRRAGKFTWPPPQENYVYEALQGAMVQAVILQRAGYNVFQWQDQALLRAFQWLYSENGFPAQGDDVWLIPLVNYYYGTSFPFQGAGKPGKNMGWTDWTHAQRSPGAAPNEDSGSHH